MEKGIENMKIVKNGRRNFQRWERIVWVGKEVIIKAKGVGGDGIKEID